jgi:hypothetical protein
MAEWKKVIVSGSNAELNRIFASGAITGSNISSSGNLFASLSINDNTGFKTVVYDPSTGKFFQTGSYGGGGGSSLFTEYITTAGSESIRPTDPSNLSITGAASLLAAPPAVNQIATQSANNYALVVSQSAYFYNHNIGYPSSNAWSTNLNGSYFNNFTANTDTSEILRFIAGLLSASAPDAAPNTKTFGSLSETINNNTTIAAPVGNVPQSSTAVDIIYLTGKGFAPTGGTIFSSKTIYNNSSYAINYSSVFDGVTAVSSSADVQLFGLGTILNASTPNIFKVSGAINWFYSDNNSETQTAVSSSQNELSNSTFSTTNGLTIGKINTVNPLIIPPAYQDGKFANIFSSGLHNGGRSFTSVSSSGWYHISASIRIASGSSTYTTPQSISEKIFWAPVSSITIPTQTVTFTSVTSGTGSDAISATSRSLSGAPYLSQSSFRFGATVNGLFNPLYTSSTTIAQATKADNLVTMTAASSRATTISTNTGTVQTSNGIFDSTGATARVTGTVPFETDIALLSGSLSFNAGLSGNTNNISQTGLGTTGFTLTFGGRNKSGTETTITRNILYHSASTFNQPLASGSLAYFGRNQGTDPNSLIAYASTNYSESFQGETYRLQITDTALSGSYTSGSKFTTSSYQVYNLTGLDLQVKPGYLIKPGGTYKYWLNDPNPSQTYKYYIRAFRRESTSAVQSMTINVGKTLVPWESTTNDSVAVAMLFKSSGKEVYSIPRLYDPTQDTLNIISSSIATDNFKNPFTSNIALYGNSGNITPPAGNTYTLPLRSIDGMLLNTEYRDFLIIVRYRGDVVPVTNISITTNV